VIPWVRAKRDADAARLLASVLRFSPIDSPSEPPDQICRLRALEAATGIDAGGRGGDGCPVERVLAVANPSIRRAT
jgi:hypothetical protein